jgi:general secretion pathway protein G
MALLAVLAAIGAPQYFGALNHARVARAIADVRALDRDIQMHEILKGCLPSTLAEIDRAQLTDPWHRPYVYAPLGKLPGGGGNGGRGGGAGEGNISCTACNGACAPPSAARKDRSLVPINATFDLYSLGKDGRSVAPLTAADSHDDIVRGNDGGFIGLARDF